MELIRKFNEAFAKGRDMKKLDSYLAFIRTCDDLIEDKMNLDVTYFFVNLYQFMKSNFTNDSAHNCINTALHCLTILERVVQEPRSRRVFLTEFNYLPVLTVMLKKFPNEKRIILNLILKMTYDLKIIQYETFLNSLIEQLVGIVHEDEQNSLLALCVLLNLCSYTGPSRPILIQTAKYSEFMRQAQQHEFFHFKLMMCLADLEERQNKYGKFLKSSIQLMGEALEQLNTVDLKQIVCYLVDCELIGTNVNVKPETLSLLQETIFPHLKVDGNQMEVDEQLIEKSRCASLIFKLMNFLLELKIGPQDFLNECESVLMAWVEDEVAGVPACDTLGKIVRLKKQSGHLDVEPYLRKLPILKNNFNRRKELIVSTIKLISALVSAASDADFSQISPDLITNLLKSVPQAKRLPGEDIELFIYGLRLLQQLASIDTSTYYTALFVQLNSPQTVSFLAQAYQSQNCNILTALFALSQEKDFPIEKVSQHISNRDQVFDLFKLVPNTTTNSTVSSAMLERKIDALIAKIDKNLNNNAPSDVLGSEIISIYQLNILLKNDEIKCAQRRLEQLEDDLKEQRHRYSLMLAKSEQLDAVTANLIVELENTCTINKSLDDELKTIRDVVKNLHKSNEQKQKIVTDLQDQANQYKNEMEVKEKAFLKAEKQLERYEKQVENFEKHIEEYRQNMKNYETALKEKDVETKKTAEKLQIIERENSRLHSLVKQMEQQVVEKNQKIEQYVEELKESEQMRQMVLNLMNKKQKK